MVKEGKELSSTEFFSRCKSPTTAQLAVEKFISLNIFDSESKAVSDIILGTYKGSEHKEVCKLSTSVTNT